MSWQYVQVLAMLGAGAIAVIVSLVVIQLRDWRRSFDVFANRVHLWVSDEVITAAAIRRLRRNSIGAAVGVLIGIGVSALWLVLARPTDLIVFVWSVELPIVMLGCVTVPMVLALRDQLYRHSSGESRVARVTPVTVRDYLSPGRFWLVPALGAAAVVLVVVGLVLSASGVIESRAFIRSPAIWACGVALALLAAGAIAARALIKQYQPAADSLELAWSDALRAETLRSLWVFEATVAWLAVVLSGLGILGALDPPIETSTAHIILLIAMDAGIITLSRILTRGGAYSYFRYRLWPDLGDVGEIVDDDADSEADAVEPQQRRP